MSGNGSSGDSAGPISGIAGSIPLNCSGLAFETVLANVDPSTHASLVVGEQLSLHYEMVNQITSVVARKTNGTYVGAITSHVAQLISCIDSGHIFFADLLGINGAAVSVQVHT